MRILVTGANGYLGRAVVGAFGGMHAPALARTVLDDGHADPVALGRGALANPDWARVLAAGADPAEFDRAMLDPEVTLARQYAWEEGRGGSPDPGRIAGEG